MIDATRVIALERSKSFPVTNPIVKEFSTGEKAILSALDKIPKSTKWDIQEEYIIETLFHEIEHASAKGFSMAALNANPTSNMFIESVHQLYCRYHYQHFFKYMNGKAPIHQGKIIAGGTAYYKRVPNLDKLLKALGLNRSERKQICKKLATQTRYADIIAEFLRSNPKLNTPKDLFEELVEGLASDEFIGSIKAYIQ